jgi:hypothetical protein
MLPQFRVALDVRQGVVLFHRSGDAEVGMHANSGCVSDGMSRNDDRGSR